MHTRTRTRSLLALQDGLPRRIRTTRASTTARLRSTPVHCGWRLRPTPFHCGWRLRATSSTRIRPASWRIRSASPNWLRIRSGAPWLSGATAWRLPGRGATAWRLSRRGATTWWLPRAAARRLSRAAAARRVPWS